MQDEQPVPVWTWYVHLYSIREKTANRSRPGFRKVVPLIRERSGVARHGVDLPARTTGAFRMPRFSKSELDAFARRLQDRRRVLIAEIRAQMAEDEDEN